MNADPIERRANAELSVMLSRIVADVRCGAAFPAAVITALRGEDRVLVAGLDWHCDEDEREALKEATFRIFGGLLASCDALTMVFDSRMRDDSGETQPCLLGAAMRLHSDDRHLLVNHLVVPYRIGEDGRGTVLEPFVPDEISVAEHIGDALAKGMSDPLEPDEAARFLRALEHAAITDLAEIEALPGNPDDEIAGIAILIIGEGPDPRLN